MKRLVFLNPGGTRNQRNLLTKHQPQMKWCMSLPHNDGVAIASYTSFEDISVSRL